MVGKVPQMATGIELSSRALKIQILFFFIQKFILKLIRQAFKIQIVVFSSLSEIQNVV